METYKTWQSSAIGRDINPSYLIGKIMAAGAKRVTVTSPVYKELANNEIAGLGTVTINYGGIEND